MRFVVLFEDHPDAGADVRRNHMSDHLAFLERNSHKVNAAGPLKRLSDKVLAASGLSTQLMPARSINWSGRIHSGQPGCASRSASWHGTKCMPKASASTWFDGRTSREV